MQIDFVSMTSEYVKTAQGGYTKYSVKYMNNGKEESKLLMSFNAKKIVEVLSHAKQGDSFIVTMDKDQKGYWQWTSIVPSQQKAAPAQQAKDVSRGTWETKEERDKKQVYIVRQSSLNNAIQMLAVNNKKELRVEDVLDTARKLEAYVFGKDINEVITGALSGDINDITEDIPF